MYEKLTKCSNFTTFALKIFSPFFFGGGWGEGGANAPCTRVSYNHKTVDNSIVCSLLCINIGDVGCLDRVYQFGGMSDGLLSCLSGQCLIVIVLLTIQVTRKSSR